MSAPPLLSLQGASLTISGKPLFERAELSIGPGERLALVGRNGSGKSTLLRIAAGEIEPDRGVRFVQPGLTVRYLPQEPVLDGFSTTLAYAQSQLGPADDPWRAQYFLNALGLRGDEDPAHLSGGEKRRSALACVLAPEPDILLLDEPTNHLDLPAIEWLEQTLGELRSALVIISHDRRFLENLSRATVWLDRGTTRRLEEGFSVFEKWRDEVLEQESRDLHKLDRKIAAEEHWVRYGVTARRKRNTRRMADLAQLRRTRREHQHAPGNVKLEASEANTSGKLVIEAKNICKSFDGRHVVKDFSIRIARGDRFGVAGANGAGKTTLVRLLTGELEPDSGQIQIGTNLEIARLDQNRQELRDEWCLKDAIIAGDGDYLDINGVRRHFAGYMKDFLFSPEQARQPIARLSGGERGRLALARALSRPSNLLVLDEPTNDLDLETLDLLEDMLADYPGTVVVVSHDRDFLDRVVTSLITTAQAGRWVEYAGGYSDMVSQSGKDRESITSIKQKSQASRADPNLTNRNIPARRKLSFKDKHALDTLPDEIQRLNARKRTLSEKLEDPDLYARDHELFHKISEAYAAVDREIAAAEEKWLELEILREHLEE